jgi:DNA topoisomerase-3
MARSAGAAPRAQAAGFGSVALGNCPVCGAQVVEQEKSYGCSAWRQGCRFAIWKTIAGKAIGARTAAALLKRGQSPLLRGFRSKAGKPFEARLKLEGGEVRFDFGTSDRPRRPPRSPDTV